MRGVLAVLLVLGLSGCLVAEADQNKHPLIGRKVEFPQPVIDGVRKGRPDIQYWYEDGTTLFITDDWLFPALRDKKRARWWLKGKDYCRSFTAFEAGITEMAKAEHLVCYRMDVIDEGAGIRFTPTRGGFSRRVWTGRYLK